MHGSFLAMATTHTWLRWQTPADTAHRVGCRGWEWRRRSLNKYAFSTRNEYMSCIVLSSNARWSAAWSSRASNTWNEMMPNTFYLLQLTICTRHMRPRTCHRSAPAARRPSTVSLLSALPVRCELCITWLPSMERRFVVTMYCKHWYLMGCGLRRV
jgi:hypothetical protein